MKHSSLISSGTDGREGPTSPLVVIPAWNEELTIGDVVSSIRAAGYEVVVINDGSTDLTSVHASANGATVLDLPINLGVGGALRCGFKYAVREGFESIVQVDGDGQHPVSLIQSLVSASHESNADMVIGSRFLVDKSQRMNVSVFRHLAMNLLSFLANVRGQVRITDTTSGFRLIRGQLLSELSNKLPSYYLGDTFEALVSARRAGYYVIEIPAPIQPRSQGSSSASSSNALKWTIRASISVLLRLQPQIAQKCHVTEK